MISLWTDGSFASADQPCGCGAVFWTTEGRLGTHAEMAWVRSSVRAEVMAVILALRAIPHSEVAEHIEVITDCTSVVWAWDHGLFIDQRLTLVKHVGGKLGRKLMRKLYRQMESPELRLAHKLANWARKGMEGRRPAVTDYPLLLDKLREIHS